MPSNADEPNCREWQSTWTVASCQRTNSPSCQIHSVSVILAMRASEWWLRRCLAPVKYAASRVRMRTRGMLPGDGLAYDRPAEEIGPGARRRRRATAHYEVRYDSTISTPPTDARRASCR